MLLLQDLAQRYEISAMPTLLYFKKGELVEKVIGADPQKIMGSITNLK